MKAVIRVLIVALFALVAACSVHPSAPASSPRALEAQWQDVFDGTPELFAIIRPQAMKRDAVYGALFKSVLRVAQAESEMTGVTALEAAEGSEEILIGIRPSDIDAAAEQDAAIVLRHVPANLDPEKMLDPSGRPLFRLVAERANVQELLAQRGVQNASIFVLADRTWVIAIGRARDRARLAFVSPLGRPVPKIDPGALAALRLDASTFRRSPRLTESAAFGPLVRHLNSMSIALSPGKGGVVATLAYRDEDASALAELHAKRLVRELAQSEAVRGEAQPSEKGKSNAPGRWAWLKDTPITRESNVVRMRIAVPLRLLEELPNAKPSDFTF